MSLFLVNNAFASNNPVQDDLALQKLLSPFTNLQHVKLNYHEKRSSMFLKQPREYQGYIEYIHPDTFIKQIQTPERKKFIIKQQQLTIISDDIDKKQIVSLNDYPQFKQFQALFDGLLQGDASKLTSYYRYTIFPLADNQVRLTLKSHLVDTFIQEQQNSSKHIEIILKNEQIKSITQFGFGGEKSELLFDVQEFEKK